MESNASQEGYSEYSFSNFEQTYVHELIHALGIQTHSLSRTNGEKYDYEPLAAGSTDLSSLDYGDKFCVMGSGEYALSLTAAYRDYLGWHNEIVRKRIDTFGTFELDVYPINSRDNTAYIEIRIPNKFSDFNSLGYKNEGYFLEVRNSSDTWDSFLTDPLLQENLEGVFVKKTDGFSSWILDMSPSSHLEFYGQTLPDLRDMALKPGMAYENSDISISTQSKNSDGSFTVSITIKEQ